jgi:raffinose/stachyose/melibiose transport system permease protein
MRGAAIVNIQYDEQELHERKALKRIRTNYKLTIFFFLLPALIVYGIFNIYGIFLTFYYSLHKWTGISNNLTFIGLGNYIKLYQDPILWHSFFNNLKLIVVSIIIQLPLGLLLALIIQSGLKGMRFFRTVYFIPMLISTVAVGILWSLIYNPTFGMINSLLDLLNLGQFKTGWLGNEKTAFIAVLITICWQYTPFYMILMRAGLVSIPVELYEVARIDGAGEWQGFRHITLPLMAGTVKTAAVLSLVGSLKYFDLIYIMTDGGPNRATELMSTYMYKNSFVEFNMGYGSSVASFIFLVAIVFVAIFQYSTGKTKTEGST